MLERLETETGETDEAMRASTYPQVLPPAPNPEPLEEVLRRTGFRASLPPEYLQGSAPQALQWQGQPRPEHPDYYGLPAIKKPDWQWYIPVYFFTGGVASGSYILSALADMQGREEDRCVVRGGRYLCIAMLGISPVLLIADLGRPERWHHMLRVFRPRSMMNQGAWGLTVFGGFAGLALLAQLAEDFSARTDKRSGGGIRPRRSALGTAVRAITWMGIPAAAYVGSYTGVLLSSTNVPLWAGNPRYLGPLFFASALGSGIAGTHLTAKMLGPVSEATEEHLRRAENVVTAAEVALTAASGASLGNLAKPLKEGKMSKAFKVGYLALGLAAPLALRPMAKNRPWLGLLSSALSLAGTAMLKYAVTEAGKESADDPQAYFEYTSPDQ